MHGDLRPAAEALVMRGVRLAVVLGLLLVAIVDRSAAGEKSHTVTITSGPAGTVDSTDATFRYTSSQPVAFACSLDGAGPVSCGASALARHATKLDVRLATTVPTQLSFAGHRYRLDRRLRRIVLPVKAGQKPLRLRLLLTAGGRSTSAVLAVRRR